MKLDSMILLMSMWMLAFQVYAKEGEMLIKNRLQGIKRDSLELKQDVQAQTQNSSCAPCKSKAGSVAFDCRHFQPQKDCLAFHQAGITVNGVYKVLAPKNSYHYAYCDQTTDGGGWTVIQRRKDGSVDFYRNWVDYKIGFGDPYGESWLGNDNIHYLTANLPKQSSLLINMVRGSNLKSLWVKYNSFSIDDESKKYTLHVGGFSGNATDELAYHNGQKFTTKDQDNDASGYFTNCARTHHGAWWYNWCYYSNLDGLYHFNILWSNYIVNFVEMKIRRNI